MVQKICLIIMLGLPLIKLGISLAKSEKDESPSASVVASIVYFIMVYAVYYFAGIFDLWK